jgi:hypothetical protein
VVYLCLLASVHSAPVFNPCTNPEPIQRVGVVVPRVLRRVVVTAQRIQGKSFILGLAWWPGGTLDDWGNGTIHPCNTQYTARLVWHRPPTNARGPSTT